MSKIKNPYAFPTPAVICPDGSLYEGAESGITLRDYFAAAALQGIAAKINADVYDEFDVAARAYRYANAMLLEREKGEWENG